MAQKKQTARKVTGGHSPRVNLAVLQKKKAKAKAASNKPSPKIPANKNSFCVMCRDGGEMWICDEEGCNRVQVKEAGVKFMCVTCHLQKTKKDPKPYFAYFPEGGYDFSQLPFNLATPESMEGYDKKASHLANTLCAYSRVVIFLTTHTDEDRGDLFTGYINKEPVAAKAFEFLQLLLKPLTKIVDGADMIFYVCGSLVTNPQNFNGVKEIAQHWLAQSPTSKASWTTQSSKAFLLPVQQRHSAIILVLWQKEGLVVEKFLWTNKYTKPWGNQLPVQCPQCGTIQKWVAGSAHKTTSCECKYSECGKNMGDGGISLPPKTHSFSIPKNATQLPQGKTELSSWLQITL
ncbi:hypothetical protein EDC04DRAFT_2601090 [Pisolithus marmoratus]|nr:hypothetical protein EDC04DRAFT_2601090 [Pisolithus marmoratus]